MVGPDGQSLFEYSVYDAAKAGFRHIVFVVNDRQDTSEFSSRLESYGDKLKVEFVVQSLAVETKSAKGVDSESSGIVSKEINPSNDGRTKPWGTAHAVLVCRQCIDNPFVVINADDYYGRNNYKTIGRYLLDNCAHPKACALPGYKLDNTLSNSGGVNRGICTVDSKGYLESIREVTNIKYDESMSLCADQSGNQLSLRDDSIVSMTFWGFMPSVFDLLENEFRIFLNGTANLETDEFYLPDMVNLAVRSGMLHVKVFDTSDQWIGLTYADDVAGVRQCLYDLMKAGAYTGMGRL